MKQVHWLPESRQMPQDHQQEVLQPWNMLTYFLSRHTHNNQSKDLQPWNRFTYILRAGKCHETISEYLQSWNRFTYFLRVGTHTMISQRTCSHEKGSLTYWEEANATRPSEKGPATMKQVHWLPESRYIYNDQPDNLQLWNWFTYFLRAGTHAMIGQRTCSHETGSLTSWDQANAISKRTCNHETGPLTNWEQAQWSARGPAAIKQVHLLPESRQMPQYHQQEDLQPWNRFTYKLRASTHIIISQRTCSHETGSLTSWEQAHIQWSARGPAAMRQVHLLPESRQMPQDHQKEDPQPWNMFAYSLRAGTHTMISQRTCNHETCPLTSWEQANATGPSARGPATMKQVLLLPESRHMYNDQPEDLQPWNGFTNKLRAPYNDQPEDLQPWNRFTYILRAGKCHMIISKRTCNHETGSLTNWEQPNDTRPSARGFTTMKQVHLHTKHRQMPQDHQQKDLQPWTGSLTAWEQAYIQ